MDRFNHSVNERITADDLNRIGLIATKGALRDYDGPLTGGTLGGYTSSDLGQGVLWGLECTTPGATKTVDIAPGAWLGFDSAIVNPYDNPRTMGRKETAETGIAIADATSTFERLYLISVPTARADLEANADLSTRDIKNPSSGVLSTQSVAKRVEIDLAAVTVTAGTEVASGTINLTDTPSHNKWTGTNGIDTHAPALPSGHIPVAIVYKDDTSNLTAADIHDARQFTTRRTPYDTYVNGSAVLPQSQNDVFPGLGVARAGGRFIGNGTSDPTTFHMLFGIQSIQRSALGEYTVRLNHAFFGVTTYGVLAIVDAGTAPRLIVSVSRGTGSLFTIKFYDEATAAQLDLTASQACFFMVYGAQQATP